MAVMGEPGASPDAVHPALQAAVEAAIDAVRAGVPASTPHATALEAARAAGLATYDAERAGHGIGLEPYEEPLLSPATGTPLLAGEVLCVEATHLELGSGGYGVRDTVVVTTSGAQVLNRSSRGLCVLD
jgi:Xaa-Pro aminopeptidase